MTQKKLLDTGNYQYASIGDVEKLALETEQNNKSLEEDGYYRKYQSTLVAIGILSCLLAVGAVFSAKGSSVLPFSKANPPLLGFTSGKCPMYAFQANGDVYDINDERNEIKIETGLPSGTVIRRLASNSCHGYLYALVGNTVYDISDGSPKVKRIYGLNPIDDIAAAGADNKLYAMSNNKIYDVTSGSAVEVSAYRGTIPTGVVSFAMADSSKSVPYVQVLAPQSRGPSNFYSYYEWQDNHFSERVDYWSSGSFFDKRGPQDIKDIGTNGKFDGSSWTFAQHQALDDTHVWCIDTRW
eukprot:CAMPEP_0195281286 /NCGR_PEP_ID=MMETSP0707-20130614/663_1 /TAXON_ID=33640 /ORGANISM="Asterionellopsis glacialis, Strain CCMP134" /LENGTH=296 /DNA_ID=CAMNT_0040340161 /DNA_START=55 /DNA_END=942 /DNA_ORIENTATION=-